MDFTYNELKNVYSVLQKKGFSFSFFDECDFKCRVYLRHDIDVSIKQALEMANFEKELGISSTFFVQPDSDFYNMLASAEMTMLEKISMLGHRLGLHVSPVNFKNPNTFADYIYHSFEYYGRFLNLYPIFSFHRPGSFDGWQTIEVAGYINTYNPRYFKEIYYFSDSNRRPVFNAQFFESLEEQKSIQLLIHPIWWSIGGRSVADVANLLIQEKSEQIKLSLSSNVGVFSSFQWNNADDKE